MRAADDAEEEEAPPVESRPGESLARVGAGVWHSGGVPSIALDHACPARAGVPIASACSHTWCTDSAGHRGEGARCGSAPCVRSGESLELGGASFARRQLLLLLRHT